MQEVLVSKIFNYTSTPTKNVEGQFWFNPSTNVLSRFNGTIWKPITVSSDDVAVLTDGNKVSLTNYLNTQIAALAEGIDSKQDKLSYYTENTAKDKASLTITGPADKSEFSVNVSNSNTQSNGSVINLSAGSNSDIVGRLNLSAYGASGGKILLSTSHAAYQNSGIELNAPLPSESDNVGENSGIIFNGPISGTGITKTITDVDYRLPTSKAVKTELDKKQDKLSNPGFLYLNNGHAISECKPTFSSAQSLVFTYKVSEDELDDAPWSIIGNIRVWDGKKGIGIAKQSKKGGNGLQCGFNWGYGQNGDTTSRNFVNATTAQFADGEPHTWALVCGKNATNGFLKLYRDGVLINSKMSLALFDDFIPEYGFSLGKHQTSASNDNPAKGRISNVAFFNFDISDSTKTYTINDYHNGKSIPQSLITATEGERAIWVLDNYTRTNSSSKKYIKDLAGNNDAIITNDIHDIIDGKVDNTISSNNTLYQTKEDNSLSTTDKTITGSINELKTSVDSKQNKLQSYSETILPPEAGGAGGAATVVINALSLEIKNTNAYKGTVNISDNSLDVNGGLSINSDIGGSSVLSAISSKPVDTKILSEKAVSDALATKQNNLQYYFEDTTKQRSEFSKTVKANDFQIGEQVSSNTGMSSWTQDKLYFGTPVGEGTFGYKGIEVTNAFFKVHGNDGLSNLKPYIQIPDGNGHSFKIWKGTETEFKALTAVSSDTVYLRVQENNRIKATVGTDTASLENITDSYTLSSTSLTSFITDTKYNNAQGSILITPSLANSGALIFGEGITDISKGFPLYPDNIVSIPFKNITNFKVAGSINDSFNYIVSFD